MVQPASENRCGNENDAYEKPPESEPPEFELPKPEPPKPESPAFLIICSAGVIFSTHTALRTPPWNFGSSVNETTFWTSLPGVNVNGFPVSASVPVKDEGIPAIEAWLPLTETIPGCSKVIGSYFWIATA